ncbi:carbohydrate kinase family protein [Candidatus Daviesbacteria bacterium]|nr:carbohydrate kinase family protein [Candidatus Daviesbacteria bacterium]
MMFDLISVGDCMIDSFFILSDAHVACNVDKTKCELCLNYADKIPVEGFHQLVAGNNANNAVGSARLGLKTAAYINIGSDINGEHVIRKLKEENVDTRYLKVNKGMDSNASAVLSFQGERTILVYHQSWKYHLPDLDNTRWIYFSSVSHSFSKTELVSQLENYLERTGARLAYNPGTYQLKYGVKKFPKLLSLMTLIIVNMEEAKLILGIDGSKKIEIKKLLKGLADLGPKLVVITDGSEGSYGYDGVNFYKLGIFPAKLLEMTGSGDAYATGLVAGLFYGKDLAEAMRWGAADGASVVEQIGPQAGLLTYEQMQYKLRESSHIRAKIFE